MIFFLFLLKNFIASNFHRVLLIDKPPVDMNCLAPQGATNNGFFGTQYFYQSLSNQGQIQSINEVTFTGFIQFKNFNQNNGKQVIFNFVDGLYNDVETQPYINLGLAILYQNNQLKLQVLSGVPSQYNLVKQELVIGYSNTDKMIQQWYHFVVSVNIQTDKLQFLNLKFYHMQTNSFYNFQTPYIQNNTYQIIYYQFFNYFRFQFQFSPFSRITNEQIIGYDRDSRLCGYLAKFTYYAGYSTMDYEYYLDYFAEPILMVRPQFDSIESETNNGVVIVKSVNYGISSNQIKIRKNTQIVYQLPDQYDNITLSFWLFPSTIDEFQLVSLVESDMQTISVGLGIDSNGALLLYSQQIKKSLGFLGLGSYFQIGLSIIRLTYTASFDSTTQSTLVRVVKNGQYLSTLTLTSITNFRYLFLGFLGQQSKDSQYAFLYDVRLYWGSSMHIMVNWNNSDCAFQIKNANKSPCLYCTNDTNQFCRESPNPSFSNISDYNLCPPSYQELPGCPQNTISNCARQNLTVCLICFIGYELQNNACASKSQFILSVQDCAFSAIFCQIINRNYITRVCNNNLQYLSNKCILSTSYYPGTCSHSYKVNDTFLGCYNCVLGTFNKGFQCVNSCAESVNNPKAFRFATSNWCVQTCPQYYDYYKNCSVQLTYGTCVSQCSTGQVINNITCLYPKQNQQKGYTESCWFQSLSTTKYLENWRRVLKCDDSCEYCYHSGPYSCLKCSDNNQFYDPLLSRCVNICDQNSMLPFSDQISKNCVRSCGSKFSKDFICYSTCPPGSVVYTNICVDQTTKPRGTYLTQDSCLRCPDTCLDCDGPTQCKFCQQNYFLSNGQCQLTCYPLILYSANNTCVSICPNQTYVYTNLDLNGYIIQNCFEGGCDKVWAGQQYDTFLHQSIPYLCVSQCDPGYYGNIQTHQCFECPQICTTCQSNFICLSCKPGYFLSKTQCFDKCASIMDYTTWTCVSQCPQGTFILEKARACLSQCGQQYLPTYKLVYQNYCYDQPPSGIGCDASNKCYICHSSCGKCNGPTDQNCLSCKPNTYLLGTVCVTDCGTLQHDMKTWMCFSTCSKGTFKQGFYCSSTCLTGYYQFGTACYESTPPGAYCLFSTSKLMYLCDPCYTGCASCTGNYPDQCGSCLKNYYYYQNICYKICPQIIPVMDSFTNQCKSTCPAPYFLQDNICQTSCTVLTYKVPTLNVCFTNGCGNGYYAKSGLAGCQICDISCTLCSISSKNCYNCSPNYYLSQNRCGTSCPPEAPYYNKISWKCVLKCETSAFTYLNKLNLLNYCLAQCPLYQLGIQCFDECPLTYYPNPKLCQKCFQQCLKCNGPTYNDCTACIMGLFLNDSQCVSQCPDDKPLDLAARTCSSDCLGYIFLEQGVCLATCPSYLYYYTLDNKKECVQKCYDGSFNKNQNCIACSPQCINCYGTSANQCTVCNKGYYFLGNECLSTCPANYYSNMIDFSCVQICSSQLYIWQQQCLFRCPNQLLNYGQYCVQQCPSYSFIRGSECLDCDPYCVQCNGPSNQECSKCTTNFYLYQNSCSSDCPQYYDDQLNACVDSCDQNQYLIEDTLRCVSTCPVKYLTSKRNCVYQCPYGQFQSGFNCQDCDPKCSQCVGSATICTACNQNFVLDINTCSFSCSDNQQFIDNINRVCQSRCPLGLYHFQAPQTNKKFCVQTCSIQYDSFCVDQCPQLYYNQAGNCTKCPFQCIECSSQINCQQCIDGYYLNTINSLSECQSSCFPRLTDLQNMTCVDQCKMNQVQYNEDCLSSCPTNPPLLQYKQQCLLDCPNGSFRDNNQCFSCDSNCSMCYGNSNTQCTSCNNGYYLNGNKCSENCDLELADMVNNMCVQTCGPLLVQDGQTCKSDCQTVQYQKICYNECPVRTFQMNKYCIDCELNCQICNQFGCLECESGYLSNYQCGTFCFLYYDEINKKCVDQCPNNSVQYLDHCTNQCPITSYQYQQKCLPDCPVSTYSDINHLCQDCQERCLKCDIQNNCVECQFGYYLYQNRCVIQCPVQEQYMDTIFGICRQSCPLNSFQKGYHCVSECSQLILNNLCLDECLDGYYQNEQFCKQCQSQCSTCESINVCTSCKVNYYLDNQECNLTCQNIMNQKLWECTDSCDGYLSNNVCYDKCPSNLLQFQQSCLHKCPNSYYQVDNTCVICPLQCASCVNEQNCSQCSIGYYLNQNQCITECPIGLYGNPSISKCVNICPSGTYKYQQLCVFDCPKPYLQSNDLCQTQCNQNQYRNGWKCYDCSIECQKCKDFGNDQCIDCNYGFVLDQSNNKCVGECPLGYYMIGSCYKCPFQCQSCDINGCLLCKGDRQLNINKQCQCNKGYFDDDKQEQCQKCPCPECTSYYNCTKCINNLQPPNCSCNKQLNEEYCISCQVASVNIYFTNSLNSIIIDFDLLINVNVVNPFQFNDCKNWFNNSHIFGTDGQCYLNWNRTQIIINLGKQSTVNVNDTLLFQTNMFKYVNDEECSDYIELFIDSTVKGPSIYIQPNIEFDIMPKISICMDSLIKQISINGTGNRDVKVLKWELNSFQDQQHYLEMKDFFNFQKDNLIIHKQTLRPNFTYNIIVTFINFLGQNNQYLLVINTISTGIPFAYFNKETLSINLFTYDCITTYRDMVGPFYFHYQIYQEQKELLGHSINTTSIYNQIPIDSLPKGIELRIIIKTEHFSSENNFTIAPKGIQLTFTKPDRFVGSIFQVEGQAYDLDINDPQIQSYGFSYEWLCMIRYSLIPCKNRENKIYIFPNSRKINVNLDFTNLSMVFYLKVQKQNRFKISSQTAIVSDINDEYQLYEKEDHIDGNINSRTTVSLQFKEPKQAVFILQNDQIIYSNKIQTSSLRFTFSDIAISKDSIIIYLLPGQQSIRFALNEEPEIIDFRINPNQGKPLDRFTYNININEKVDQQPYQYSLYYYLLPQTLEQDIIQQSNINGIPIIIDSKINNGNFTLPSNIAGQNITILLEVKTNKGSYSIKTLDIKINEDECAIKDLNQKIIKFNEQNNNTIIDIFNGVQLYKSQTQQVCLKQCSGVGTCVDKQCQCPIGYYFDDCSGTQQDYQQFQQLFISIYQQVLNSDVDYNNYVLYIRLINYLKQFEFLEINNMDQMIILLDNLNNNIKYRLNQINNYTIGLLSQNNSEFNYNQMDTKSIVNKLDLQTTINLTTIVWTYLLNNFTQYELQYKLRILIQNTIELYLIGLLPDENAILTYDACKIIINRTNSTNLIINNNNNKRLLSQNIQYYDIIQVVYIKNLYCNDGYYPYIAQCNIVYDYQIRQMNRLYNIQLNTTVNYTFNIDNSQFQLYVCIQRDQFSYQWTDEYCTTSVLKNMLYCNCSVLAPTTFIKDYQLIYSNPDLYHFTLPNMVIFGYLIQFMILVLIYFISKAQTNNISTKYQSFKFGHVSRLIKANSVQFRQIEQEDSDLQSQRSPQHRTAQNDQDFKFHLNNFHKYHYLLRVIFKQKELIPVGYRILVIWLRWSLSMALISLFTDQLLTFYIAIHPALGITIFLRLFCQGFEQSYKKAIFLKEYIKLFVILLAIFLILVLSTLLIVYQSYQITDQTDWFLSYYISFLIDILCVDFILFIIQKYLGFEIREQFKKKIKQIQKIQQLKDTNRHLDY